MSQYHVRLSLPINGPNAAAAIEEYALKVMKGGFWNVTVHDSHKGDAVMSGSTHFQPLGAQQPPICPKCEKSADVGLDGEVTFVSGVFCMPMFCDSCLKGWEERR